MKIEEFDNGAIYEGEWNRNYNETDGIGVLIDEDGNLYEGTFYLGQCKGRGRFISREGVYEGFWDDGVREGIGKFKSFDGGEQYEGNWKND